MDKALLKELLKEMFKSKEIQINLKPDHHYGDYTSMVLTVIIDGEEVYSMDSYYDAE